ncbi:MAG: hypothetical protein OMM_05143 [Candidatus Magnetoglobus multicellularis str. Araruama]|uniref:ABC transmembrane type-1 domain-containing protein n=1 Tax=Candidatus Magnetoglobus multicellularis str. Araruama TaxID=890399 RepID=A0A1V1NXT1_9BACT|nr:MAG: hypothetical protein OMM_05143 [Candidatus Magnetoglobus multicellularis str. Araruama]
MEGRIKFRELIQSKSDTQIIKLIFVLFACTFFELLLIVIIVSGADCAHHNTSLSIFTIYSTAYILFLITSLQTKHMVIKYTEEVVSNIRQKIIKKVRKVDTVEYEKLNLSEIYNVITIDTQNVADIVDSLWYLFNSIILSLFILLYVSYYSQMTFMYVILFC